MIPTDAADMIETLETWARDVCPVIRSMFYVNFAQALRLTFDRDEVLATAASYPIPCDGE